MSFTRIFNEILKPICIIVLLAVIISLLADCYGFTSIFDLCISFDNIIQIEFFLLTIIITVLVIRIAIIDTEEKTIREKINSVFDEYEYYGHLLFEKQLDNKISAFYKQLEKRDKNQIEIEKGILDKKRVESFQKHYRSLKQYRQDHIQAIKPISILIALLIAVCLILNLFNLDCSNVILLSLKTGTISMTVYTIYESIHAVLCILTHPFTENN